MQRLFVISGGVPVPEPDPSRWAAWLNAGRDRKGPTGLVTRIELAGGPAWVLTRFVALDCGLDPWGDPLLYETLIVWPGGRRETLLTPSAALAVVSHLDAVWSFGPREAAQDRPGRASGCRMDESTMPPLPTPGTAV